MCVVSSAGVCVCARLLGTVRVGTGHVSCKCVYARKKERVCVCVQV